jgi:hypothetical protein
MKKMKYIILSIILIASSALAYEPDYGPFTQVTKVKRLIIKEVEAQSFNIEELEPEGQHLVYKGEYIFVVNEEKEKCLKVTYDKAFFVELIVDGKTVLEKTEFSDYQIHGGPEVFSADLNQDHITDFIIYSFTGGNGIVMNYCYVAFILSSEKQYKLTTVSTMYPYKNDFVIINNMPCYVQTSFLWVKKCNDGKRHNFFMYNLLTFEKENIKVNNILFPVFPKIVWYSYNPNHKETSLLTEEQKKEFRKIFIDKIFWKKGNPDPWIDKY